LDVLVVVATVTLPLLPNKCVPSRVRDQLELFANLFVVVLAEEGVVLV
jgi:hypothetical protein